MIEDIKKKIRKELIEKIGNEQYLNNVKKIEIKIRNMTNKILKKNVDMIDYDKVSIDYIKDLEEDENYIFDLFDFDFINEKKRKK